MNGAALLAVFVFINTITVIAPGTVHANRQLREPSLITAATLTGNKEIG